MKKYTLKWKQNIYMKKYTLKWKMKTKYLYEKIHTYIKNETKYLYEKHIHLNKKKSVNETDLMIEDL